MNVTVHRCDDAPASDRWDATENGYDLDVPIGHGDTPLAAIENLLWAMNIEDIKPEDCVIDWC